MAKKQQTTSNLVGRVVCLTDAGVKVATSVVGYRKDVTKPEPKEPEHVKILGTEGEVLEVWREDGTVYVQVQILGGAHEGELATLHWSYIKVSRRAPMDLDEEAREVARIAATLVAPSIHKFSGDSGPAMRKAVTDARQLLAAAREGM